MNGLTITHDWQAMTQQIMEALGLTSPPSTHSDRQALWDPRAIEGLGLSKAAMSTEHKRLLKVCTETGWDLRMGTATAWHIRAPNRQAVVLVAASGFDEDAGRMAALLPDYTVPLPDLITPENLLGPWVALCETNYGALAIRNNLRRWRVWKR